MPAITVRTADASDAPRMAEIAFSAWEGSILPILAQKPGQEEAERRRLARAAGHGWHHAMVADLNGIVVGWCSRNPGRSYIPYLFVMPEVQGNGIGGMLLRRMETLLELEGADRVHLETPADHVRAVRFYERQGYRIMALGRDGHGGYDPFASVHLQKRLQPFLGLIDEE